MATPAHKSATSVTLAPLDEKSGFELFVHTYWKLGAVVAAAIAGGVIVAHQLSQKQRAARAESWDALNARAAHDPFTGTRDVDDATWASLAADLKGGDAGPWIRLMQAQQLVEDRKYDEATDALEQLRAEYPGHPLLGADWRVSDDASAVTFLALIEQRLGARAEWEAARPELFGNPPPAADAPRVVLETAKGEIVVALFPSKAPQHVAKFLELVDGEYFDGMAVYDVAAGMSFSLGDPNTKGEDVTTWGQGGRDLVIPSEETGLHHFAGAVSAEASETKGESLAGRFSVFTADSLFDDDTRVVFGVVESGLEVAREIAAADVGSDPNAPGLPAEPIRITSVKRR